MLALPRLALEKLYIGSNLVNVLPEDDAERLWNNLQTTTDQSLLKINLYYDKAWWGAIPDVAPVGFGPNFSDLPLGSVYPFYAISEELSAAAEYQEWLVEHDQLPSKVGAENLKKYQRAKYDQPAALTIYCDYLNINFWRSLQDMEEKFTSPLQKEHSKPPQTIYPASTAVVSAATELFGKLFATDTVPAPVMTSARIWMGSTVFGSPPEQQVGYGVHQWGLHADDREVIKAMIEPLPNLFTCGEAFSDYQGWVEGALRSADLVLACEPFGLEPISAVYEQTARGHGQPGRVRRLRARTTAQIRKYIEPDFDPTSAGPKLDPTREATHRLRALRRRADESRCAGSARTRSSRCQPTARRRATSPSRRTSRRGWSSSASTACSGSRGTTPPHCSTRSSSTPTPRSRSRAIPTRSARATRPTRTPATGGSGRCTSPTAWGRSASSTRSPGPTPNGCRSCSINGAPTNKEACVEANAGLVYSHTTGYDLVDVDVFRPVTAAAERVTNARQAPFQIDSVLTAMLTEHRPGYLEVAEDVWRATCSRPARDAVVRGERHRHFQRARRGGRRRS